MLADPTAEPRKRTINKHRHLVRSVPGHAAKHPERYGVTDNVAARTATVAAFTAMRAGELLAVRRRHASFRDALPG